MLFAEYFIYIVLPNVHKNAMSYKLLFLFYKRGNEVARGGINCFRWGPRFWIQDCLNPSWRLLPTKLYSLSHRPEGPTLVLELQSYAEQRDDKQVVVGWSGGPSVWVFFSYIFSVILLLPWTAMLFWDEWRCKMHTKLEKLWHNMSSFSLNTVLGTLYCTNISC